MICPPPFGAAPTSACRAFVGAMWHHLGKSMSKNQRAIVGPRFAVRFINGTWAVLDRSTFNHRAFSLFKLADQEAGLMNARGLPW